MRCCRCRASRGGAPPRTPTRWRAAPDTAKPLAYDAALAMDARPAFFSDCATESFSSPGMVGSNAPKKMPMAAPRNPPMTVASTDFTTQLFIAASIIDLLGSGHLNLLVRPRLPRLGLLLLGSTGRSLRGQLRGGRRAPRLHLRRVGGGRGRRAVAARLRERHAEQRAAHRTAAPSLVGLRLARRGRGDAPVAAEGTASTRRSSPGAPRGRAPCAWTPSPNACPPGGAESLAAISHETRAAVTVQRGGSDPDLVRNTALRTHKYRFRERARRRTLRKNAERLLRRDSDEREAILVLPVTRRDTCVLKKPRVSVPRPTRTGTGTT